MERTIVGYHTDELGDWVGELDCGHNQHLRHRPPFQVRAWVIDPAGREAHLGTPIACPLCDRAELPEGLSPVASTPAWDEHSMPVGLRREHRLPAGRWGLLQLVAGRLRFRASTEMPIDLVLVAPATQPIPPTAPHEVEPLGPVSFSITFLERTAAPTP